jgi:pyruvate dehydrogenase E2 component (dihydrolipoamide acetyltransferase)
MEVLMPQLGETVDKGKVTTWFKKVGDPIKPGDNLFEIETDKVSMEVPSTTTGVLAEIRVQVGEDAPVGAVVAVISDGSAASASPAPASAPAPAAPAAPKAAAPAPAPAATPAPAQAPRSTGPVTLDPYFEVRTPAKNYGSSQMGGRATTPLARRLAAEAGIDLSNIKGSGPHGRVVAKDIEGAAPARGAGATLAGGLTTAQVKAIYKDTPYEEVPLDGMRKTIATRLVQAKQTIPHFYLTIDLDIGSLLKLREEANAGAPRDKDGKPAFKLSVNDFVI